MSKSRVAPLKPFTIQGGPERILLETIGLFVVNSNFCEPLIANRVKTILDVSSKDQWHYVESKNNPADDASRGLSITKFLGSQQGTEVNTGFQATSVLTKGQRQRSRSKSEHNTRRQ